MQRAGHGDEGTSEEAKSQDSNPEEVLTAVTDIRRELISEPTI